MTPAELKMTRELLGLSGEWLGGHLGVSGRTVRHWEAGRYEIPAGVGAAVERLRQVTAAEVKRLAAAMDRAAHKTITVYYDDAGYRAAHPAPAGDQAVPAGMPAAWHRVVVARVRELVPDVRAVFPDDDLE